MWKYSLAIGEYFFDLVNRITYSELIALMILNGKCPISDPWLQTAQINAVQCWMTHKDNMKHVKMDSFYPQDSYYAGLKENEAVERAKKYYERKNKRKGK